MLLDDPELNVPKDSESSRPVHHHNHNGRHARRVKDDEIPEIVWWIAGAGAVLGVGAAGYMALDNMNKQKAAQQQLLMQQQQRQQQTQSPAIQHVEAQMMDTAQYSHNDGHVEQTRPAEPAEVPHISQGYSADAIKPDLRQEPTGEEEEEEPTLKEYSDVNSGQQAMETHQQMKNTIPDNPYLQHMMEEAPPKKKFRESLVDIFCPAL